MAELLEQRGDVAGGLDALRRGRDAERGRGHQADAQAPRRGAELRGERSRRRDRVVPGKGVGAGGGVEDLGRVGDGAGDRALDHRAHPVLRPPRDATAAGLEADQPAVGGRDADRAATVVGVGDREHAAGDRGGGTAGGAARRAARVPGVAAVAVAVVLGHGDRAELGRVGAPAEDEAGREQFLDHQLALLARPLGGSVGAEGQRPAGDGGQVLDRDRHAKEGRLLAGGETGVGLAGRRPGGLVVAPDHRVQLRVALVDRGQARLEQLDRGELMSPQRGRELERGAGWSKLAHQPDHIALR